MKECVFRDFIWPISSYYEFAKSKWEFRKCQWFRKSMLAGFLVRFGFGSVCQKIPMFQKITISGYVAAAWFTIGLAGLDLSNFRNFRSWPFSFTWPPLSGLASRARVRSSFVLRIYFLVTLPYIPLFGVWRIVLERTFVSNKMDHRILRILRSFLFNRKLNRRRVIQTYSKSAFVNSSWSLRFTYVVQSYVRPACARKIQWHAWRYRLY